MVLVLLVIWRQIIAVVIAAGTTLVGVGHRRRLGRRTVADSKFIAACLLMKMARTFPLSF